VVLSEGEKVVSLLPLDSISAAKLFACKAPRKLNLPEMNATSQSNALEALARTALLQALKGHPRAISMMVPHLQDQQVQ
jgi:hypothetical protein